MQKMNQARKNQKIILQKQNFFKDISDLSLIFIVCVCIPLEIYLNEPTNYTFIFESIIF